MKYDPHIGDPDLIALDELPERRKTQVRAHLDDCARCRTRRDTLNRNLAALARVATRPIANDAQALDRLQAAMRDAAPVVASPRPQPRVYWGATAAAAALTLIALISLGERPVNAGPLPDSKLTPGAARLVKREDVCQVRDDDYPVNADLAQRVFQNYRIRKPQPRSYEVDYLIAPALGGADDIRNLWPQPYTSGEWTAHVKDALEDHLRDLVCNGGADLQQVQQDIARDWIAAYRKYFHTDRPLPQHVSFLKDRPWE